MNNNWITNQLPDDDILVLVRVESTELPICLGYHDAGRWFYSDSAGHLAIEPRVLGWMHLEDAAKHLDATPPI
jgi:hypothetical protein